MGQKPFECGRGHRSPHQPLDEGGIGRVKGMQIGVGFPFLQQSFYVPSPLLGPADRVKRVAPGREVRQQGAAALGPAMPAEDQAQTQGAPA